MTDNLCPDCLRARNVCECPRCVHCGALEDYCQCEGRNDWGYDDASDDLTDKETPEWLE